MSVAGTVPVPEKFLPADPSDGAVVGPRVVFQIGYDESVDLRPRELRFRIRLMPVDGEGRSYDFNRKHRRGGWLFGAPGRVLYRPLRPIEDGTYRWHVEAWNGVEWVEGQGSATLRVDGVAPAPVSGLVVQLRRERDEVLLEWDPVTLDRQGRPEYVTRYHVYRFEPIQGFRLIRTLEIGAVDQPRFVDVELPEKAATLLYYRVTAEDEAGNEGRTQDAPTAASPALPPPSR